MNYRKRGELLVYKYCFLSDFFFVDSCKFLKSFCTDRVQILVHSIQTEFYNLLLFLFVFVSNDDVNSMVIFYATGLFQFDTVITHVDLKTDCRNTDITGFPIPCIPVDA